jgi:hypothetical protein
MYIEMGKNKDEREREAKEGPFFMTKKFNGHIFCGQWKSRARAKKTIIFF